MTAPMPVTACTIAAAVRAVLGRKPVEAAE